MKAVGLIVGAVALAAGIQSFQSAGPAVPEGVRKHVETMRAAKTLRARVLVTDVSGGNQEISVAFARPNRFKIERADGFTLSDGKTVYEYTGATSSYTEHPYAPEDLTKAVRADELFAWTVFFEANALANVSDATDGKSRTLKGIKVQEVALRTPNRERTAGLLVDEQGVARGFTLETPKKNLVAIATEFEVGGDLPESTFAFVAPPGAKKVEPAAVSPKYAEVQAIFDKACLPCHGAGSSSGGVDLSSYNAVVGGRGSVVKGNPDSSAIVRAIRSGRMPKGRGKLPQTEVDTIVNWIKAGANPD
ncbi:MAG: c-type cytochrome [Fimbriimonadaceae bacterium]|nr:c-type cytochrome [Fimbriimonadaceae bacterium]